MQTLSLSLKPELLNLNAIELLGTDSVELIPHFAFQDGLIYQIGLALQAELRSQGCGSRIYAETLANTLAIHLLRDYSTQNHRTVTCDGGLPQHKLKLVTDYINDYLERELEFKRIGGDRPHEPISLLCRGLGVALICAIAHEITCLGWEFMRGSALSGRTARLYERFAVRFGTNEYNVSGKALRQLASLVGKPEREIVYGLPTVAMNYE